MGRFEARRDRHTWLRQLSTPSFGLASPGRAALRHVASAGVVVRIASLLCCAAVAAAVWSASASAAMATVHPYLSSFGSFFNVQGVATDASGDVYVFDTGAATIFKFDAAGNPVNFVATGTNEISGVGGGGASENELAVDNSTGPTAGDIYVASGSRSEVKIFSPEGSPLTPLSPEEGIPWNGEACGVAVDPSGNVYIGVFSGQILKYTPTASPVTNANYSSSIGGAESPCNIAVDEAGSVFSEKYSEGPITRYEPSQFGSSSATGSVIDSKGSTLAVDPANQELYVDETSEVAQFGTHGEPVSTFAGSGEGAIGGSFGIAVGPVNHEIYVSDGSGQLSVFGTDRSGHIPTVTTGSASDVVAGGATLNGSVNPEEAPIGECFFEYGESSSYGKTIPCAESPTEIGSGDAPVAVHANVTGLTAPTYHFRLVASQTVKGFGEDSSFAALVPPAVENTYVTNATSTSATLQGNLNPRSNETTYHFEYGTDDGYGASSPAGHLGSSSASTLVAAHLQGLTAGTTYHYRLVATNLAGTKDGPDSTFTTESIGGPLTLLDGRQWELVSPPLKHGADIRKEGIGGDTIVQAAASGDAITYVSANPIAEDPEGNGAPEPSQELSRRAADGTWSTRTLNLKNEETHELPIGTGLTYKMFNTELTVAALVDYDKTPLAPDATNERGPYLRDEAACNEGSSSCFTPFLTRENTKPGAKWDVNDLIQTSLVDATEDLKYSVISSEVPLTEGASEGGSFFGQAALYEWSEGHLENVSINDAGESVDGTLGGREGANVQGAISSDGSRVFWCELSCDDALFVRDTATAKTTRINEPTDITSEFQIATQDGSRVFYTIQTAAEPGVSQLWECTLVQGPSQLECERTEVAAGIEGLVPGINQDGTTVYFDSNEALVSGAEAGGNNFYVAHLENGKWIPRLIAALDPSHNGFGQSAGDIHDWGQPNDWTQEMTSRVSPNGRYLAFMSDRSLTGYDNHDAISGEADQEVFVYDDQDHKLTCASCSQSGVRPEGIELGPGANQGLINAHDALSGWVAAAVPPWQSSAGKNALRQPRYLSNEGRLLFNSVTPLVPQDSNGLADVYEYEPAETGSCAQLEGCVQLISSGKSGEESAFLEASESGGDVFFLTSAKLTAQDTDTEYDVYDARICTAASPCAQESAAPPPPCNSGEGCKAAPMPQPAIFGAPASATFSGVGNPASAPAAKAKPMTRAQKLAKALKTCRKDKSKSKRSSCEKQARKRYGPKPKAKAKSHKAKAHKGGK
jgi:WD40-like Beta Propeller Repeat